MRWFHEKGWQVDYASPCEEEIMDCDNSYKINITRNPFSLSCFIAIKELKRLITNNQYTLIHCHTPMGAVVSRLASVKARKKGLKIIYTAHGFHFYNGSPAVNWMLYYPIEKILSRYTDVLITINEEDYNFARKKFFTKAIFKIDGVGVDLKKFQPVSAEEKSKKRKQFGYVDQDFILLYIGEFISRKNHQLLFDVLPELYKRIPELKVIFCGDGVLIDWFISKTREIDLQEIIWFAGYRKDVNAICAISDIHIALSKQEGQGLNNIEAMASGLPIVATKIRGHVDVVQDKRNGLLFDLNSKDELIEKVLQMYCNKDERLRYSENNIRDVEKFSINKAVNKMADIYSTVISSSITK